MTFTFADVPLWAAVAGSAFLLLGSGLVLLGTIGLVRLPTFYERMHAPTLGTSWGAAGMVMGSMFDVAFRKFSAAFEARADAIYGKQGAPA